MRGSRKLSHRAGPQRDRRGSALIMAIVVSVVITSLVLMVGWISTTMVQSTSNYMKKNRAQYVAEGAAQRAYWRFKKDQTYRASPVTGSDTVDGQTYSWSVTVVGA